MRTSVLHGLKAVVLLEQGLDRLEAARKGVSISDLIAGILSSHFPDAIKEAEKIVAERETTKPKGRKPKAG